MNVGYFKDTIKGLTWMSLLRGSTRAMAFVRIAVLARILSPLQFGIFGIASLMLEFFEVITETGINIFLVQDEGKLDDYINTAWIVSMARGFIISILLLLGSSMISVFFKSPDAKLLLMIISVVPLLRGFINPAIVKFQKELAFNKEFIFRIVIFAFDATVSIVFAFITKSAISLVWGLLAGVLLEIIMSFYFVKPRPAFKFEIQKVKRVIHRGKWMTFAGFFNYLFGNGDDWVVGRILGATSLGIYQIAYKISGLPIDEVGEIFNKVTFPVYTKIKNEKQRLRDNFFRVTLMISALAIPFGIILFIFTKPLVLLVLGNNWLETIPAIKILSIFGVIRAISGSTSPLFLAVNKQEYVTLVTLLSILGLGVTIIPFVYKYGIIGAAYSAVTGALLSLPVMIYYTYKILK